MLIADLVNVVGSVLAVDVDTSNLSLELAIFSLCVWLRWQREFPAKYGSQVVNLLACDSCHGLVLSRQEQWCKERCQYLCKYMDRVYPVNYCLDEDTMARAFQTLRSCAYNAFRLSCDVQARNAQPSRL